MLERYRKFARIVSNQSGHSVDRLDSKIACSAKINLRDLSKTSNVYHTISIREAKEKYILRSLSSLSTGNQHFLSVCAQHIRYTA